MNGRTRSVVAALSVIAAAGAAWFLVVHRDRVRTRAVGDDGASGGGAAVARSSNAVAARATATADRAEVVVRVEAFPTGFVGEWKLADAGGREVAAGSGAGEARIGAAPGDLLTLTAEGAAPCRGRVRRVDEPVVLRMVQWASLDVLVQSAGAVVGDCVVEVRCNTLPGDPSDATRSSATTDAAGRARFPRILPGRPLHVTVTDRRFVPAERPLRGISPGLSEQLIVECERGTRIVARFLDADGLPVAGHAVWCLSQTSTGSGSLLESHRGTCVTDAHGQFETGPMPRGRAVLKTLRRRGNVYDVHQVAVETDGAAAELHAGPHTQRASSVRVRLSGAAPGVEHRFVIGATGAFAQEGTTTTCADLAFRSDGTLEIRGLPNGPADWAVTHVVGGTCARGRSELGESTEIEVSTTCASGEPPPGPRPERTAIRIPASAGTTIMRVDHGSITLAVEAGAEPVRIEVQPGVSALWLRGDGARWVPPDEVARWAEAGGPRDLPTLLPGRKIGVRVTSSGEQVRAARCRIVGFAEDARGIREPEMSAGSGEDGVVWLDGVPAGPQGVRIEAVLEEGRGRRLFVREADYGTIQEIRVD